MQVEYHNGPRIIPYADRHRPTNFRTDLGDATARWEGPARHTSCPPLPYAPRAGSRLSSV